MRALWLFPLFLNFSILSHAAAIHDAAMSGNVATITAALDAGADINESDGTATPLYFAVFMGHVPATKLLIERGADVNALSALGHPLMAAMGEDKIDLLKLLLDGGANPNFEGGSQPPLHVAVNLGCFACVKALVEAGADVNARAEGGRTPLHLATRSRNGEIADYLLSQGVVIPTPDPIAMKLASADVEQGRISFSRLCNHCHGADPQGGGRTGPNLWDVVGRDKASLGSKLYSDTLLAWAGVWTFEDLNKFLLEPMVTTPGVSMETLGVPDEIERANLIAFLRTLSDKPIPLP